MGYAVGFRDDRWIGYGVPAECDRPECTVEIDRGMGYVCGDVWGAEDTEGCGLFFCARHGGGSICERCEAGAAPFAPKPDSDEWVDHMLTDESWEEWRGENPAQVEALRSRLDLARSGD